MLVDLIILIPTFAMISFLRYCIIQDTFQNTQQIQLDTESTNEYDKEKDL